MSRKIIFLLNPISGTGGKDSLKLKIAKWATKHHISYEIHPTTIDGNYEHLTEKIYSERFDTIAICGGDGSVNAVVAALAHTGVQFGIIPMGSGNGLAFAANIPKNKEDALHTLINGHALDTDAFRVNGQFACMLCGIGFDAIVAHEFAQQSTRGLVTYATLTTKNLFNASPFPFSVEANGYEFKTDAYFISIANSNQFGNHVTIAPDAQLSDGLLDIVIVKKMAKPVLVYNLIKQILTGKHSKIEQSLLSPVIYFQTNHLIIRNPTEAPMHIDGEPHETYQEVRIELIPKFFKLIHGA